MHRATGVSWRAALRWRATKPAARSIRSALAARFSTTGAVVAAPSIKTAQVATDSCSSMARDDRSRGRSVLLALLETSVAEKKPAQALACFDQLQAQSPLMPEAPQLLQKLVLLVAKRGERDEIPRAAQIMRAVLVTPSLEPGDYTQLASIYVLAACLRVDRLAEALEIFEAARAVDVTLDVPAYDALLKALADAGRAEQAVGIIASVVAENEVNLTEGSFSPVLLALMLRSQYEDVTALLDLGRENDVIFSIEETYDSLVSVGEMQEAAFEKGGSSEEMNKKIEQLGMLMEYINRVVKEDQLMAALDDVYLDDDDGGVDTDDDDDDDLDFDDEDFDDEDFDDEDFDDE